METTEQNFRLQRREAHQWMHLCAKHRVFGEAAPRQPLSMYSDRYKLKKEERVATEQQEYQLMIVW